MMFLLNRWDSLMNYNPKTSFDEAVRKESQFNEMFKQVQSLINMKKSQVKDTTQSWSKVDIELNNLLETQ